jgi:hypothetical protein
MRINGSELATDKEYNSKAKRQWSQKALHGRHAYDLSQQCVDTKASNKWLRSADMFAEKRVFNNNKRPSHTNKKLQEIYFEATKHR